MDLRMPRLDGLAATRALCSGPLPRPRVVVVTTFVEDESVVEALRAGAIGYVLKDAPEAQLLAAVHGGEGAALLDARVVAALLERTPRSAPPTGLDQLTSREVEVLELLALGLSNAQLARRLVLGEATVKTHVARVLDELGLESRAQAGVAAYESGLVRPGGQAQE
jgi:DNA-binding NarL/FixJ family response regulator